MKKSMIQLTTAPNTLEEVEAGTVFVDPTHITAIAPTNNSTILYLTGAAFAVTETFKEIVDKIQQADA